MARFLGTTSPITTCAQVISRKASVKLTACRYGAATVVASGPSSRVRTGQQAQRRLRPGDAALGHGPQPAPAHRNQRHLSRREESVHGDDGGENEEAVNHLLIESTGGLRQIPARN
jgi:hypothetical protein